ncbi:MAG: 4-hydroxy-tetrahydrodipicolinate reductase [Oscillospiraceae bacterium]|jgi:4-hydroxy-tetrahydrodipicolinate reductase|nr:4-hydroxy-tetrahydrodipicolinate reductase [Oscillospiraceae bacterium]
MSKNIKLFLSGAASHMGQAAARVAAADADVEIVAGSTRDAVARLGFPTVAEPLQYAGEYGVLLDFSSPDKLSGILRCAAAKRVPLVLCTTGYSAEQLGAIRAAAESVPVFRSGNMSLGVNLVAKLAGLAARSLGGAFDAEIVERHHRRKADAPSGTALLLADAIAENMRGRPEYVYGRSERRGARPDGEIGISSVRGGTIVGEHEVIFAGPDEVIEIRHTAYSRDVFAVGALAAVKFVAAARKPGLYDMDDLLADGSSRLTTDN